MSERDDFERILASLHDAMLDGARWPRTSALIDEACGARGSVLLVGEGPKEDVRAHVVGLYYRGERREDLEREYVESYHATDEAVPRIRQQPYGRLVGVADSYSEKERSTSRAFNEFHRRSRFQRGLSVRLDGPEGYSHITWVAGDPVGSGGEWSSSQIAMIKRVAPHIRQLVCMRQALSDAAALGRSLAELLDIRGLGVILLDRSGGIMVANDRARALLRCDDGLSDRRGFLRASQSADRARFDRLLSDALPEAGSVAVGGSMALHRPCGHRPFLIHVTPTADREMDFTGRRAVALVLVADPWRPFRIAPEQVAVALGLTRAESEVAGWLAEGKTVREIAASTGRQKRSIYWLLERIYAKLGIRRQVDLVRLVLAVAKRA